MSAAARFLPSWTSVQTTKCSRTKMILVVNGGIRHLARSANFDVRHGCLPAVCGAAYQLRRSIRFISGSPVRLAVATSEVIFPNNCGFLKSTVEFGAEKPKLWSGFWKS